MSERKKSCPAYTLMEKVGLGTLIILSVFLLTGWGLCHFSFNGKELARPGLNFAGLIVMLILPGSASLVFGLCRQISRQEIWQHCQEIWEKFFLHMPAAAGLALYYSSNQGYMTLKITTALILSWVIATFAFYYLNHLLRHLGDEDEAQTQI